MLQAIESCVGAVTSHALTGQLSAEDCDEPLELRQSALGDLENAVMSVQFCQWELEAKQKIPSAIYNYVYGYAGMGRTAQANAAAFSKYPFIPRMLRRVATRSQRLSLFGLNLNTPIIAAPVGVQGLMHNDGELATARACAKCGVPMILSTLASNSIEDVARANQSGVRWFQLYWPRSEYEDVTISLLKRARENNYTALVVTLDTFLLGWRPLDLDAAYSPFTLGAGSYIGLTDPAFRAMCEKEYDMLPLLGKASELATNVGLAVRNVGQPVQSAKILLRASQTRMARKWMEVVMSGGYRDWCDLAILRRHWDGPIILKGIQSLADASLAVEADVDGIIISNHGGRQLDNAIASLDALAEIANDPMIKGSGMEILFDSGVRSGSDVLTALCLGAKAVLVGRAYAYGLAAKGQAGVEHVFKALACELDSAMANVGIKNLQEADRQFLKVPH